MSPKLGYLTDTQMLNATKLLSEIDAERPDGLNSEWAFISTAKAIVANGRRYFGATRLTVAEYNSIVQIHARILNKKIRDKRRAESKVKNG